MFKEQPDAMTFSRPRPVVAMSPPRSQQTRRLKSAPVAGASARRHGSNRISPRSQHRPGTFLPLGRVIFRSPAVKR